MRTLTPFKWKGAAAVCFAAALVLDFVAKQFAVAAATGATPVERQPNAVASDMFAGIGLGVACVGGLLWIASYLRYEGGSGVSLVILLAIYLLFFFVTV
jgi:hypothetical protein